MLSSISPLGERAKGNRWGLTATAHVLGSTAGGVMIGALAGTLGSVLVPADAGMGPLVLLGSMCLAAAAWDVTGRRVPSWRRQVNEDWLRMYRGWVYGGGFGFQLGLAVVTIITSAATYAMLAAALLSGTPGGGAAVGGAFGLARGLVLLTGARVRDADGLRSYHRRLEERAPLAHRVTVAGLLITGTLSLIGGFTA